MAAEGRDRISDLHHAALELTRPRRRRVAFTVLELVFAMATAVTARAMASAAVAIDDMRTAPVNLRKSLKNLGPMWVQNSPNTG
jgi:hypothetical protein